MNLVESQWRQRRIRTEEGIFLASDELSEVCGEPRNGYRVDTREPVALLQRADPDGWISINETCRAETNQWRIIAGLAGREDSGFVAVEHSATGALQWLLHLHAFGEIVDLSADKELIRAISMSDAGTLRWTIPISDPELFSAALDDRN